VPRSSGILLAGGAARRFGRPKHVEPFAGAPLFHLPLRALLVSCDEVLVVLAPDAREPVLPQGRGAVGFVRDAVAHEGPLSGLRAGLAAATGEFAAVAGADMPGLSAAVLELMLAEARRRDRAVVLNDGSTPVPLPAAVPVARARGIAERLYASGERRLRALMAELAADGLGEEIWATADPKGAWRQDVDTPEDLPELGGG
jgi:molybdenum cofactor guanylyltransferase